MKPMAIKLPFFDHGKALLSWIPNYLLRIKKPIAYDNRKPFDHDTLDGFHIFEIRFSPSLFLLALSASFSTQ
jgi:hypothetical protein